jgi:DNA-binding response OmpR family regulator
MSGSTLLVVDDEPRILEFLAENLEADDYAVLTAGGGEEALALMERSRPDLVLLDVVLPDMTGYEMCRRVREADGSRTIDPRVPIIMLSAKVEHTDRVRGLTRGADDYVTKPFHYPELLARIEAVLKRSRMTNDGHRLRAGELVINTLARTVTVRGMEVPVSGKEYALLATLAAQPEKVFTKRELLETVWEFRSPGRTRTIDSHASRLRQKLAAHSQVPYIVNVWGVGSLAVAVTPAALRRGRGARASGGAARSGARGRRPLAVPVSNSPAGMLPQRTEHGSPARCRGTGWPPRGGGWAR